MSTELSLTDPEQIQQYFYELLGDTDWDLYKSDEHILLKRKVGFALFGSPFELIENDTGTGFNQEQNEKIEKIYTLMIKNNYNEKSNNLLIRIIFIVYKLSRKVDKKESVCQTPVFVIKKCDGKDCDGDKTCKIFIDELGRVYESWKKYLNNNKLPKCKMYCPLNGKYSATLDSQYMNLIFIDDDNLRDLLKVNLEIVESPACSVGNQVLDGVDTTGTVLSVGSATVMAASLIPAVTLAPAVLTGAAVTGLGVCLYSVGRSIGTLVERKIYKQTISLADRESRACWINVTIGALGATTSAATGLLTKAVSNGKNISNGFQIAFNALNITNMAGTTMSLLYSGYNIIDKVINKEPISSLEIFQFSTSILFFYKSAVDFRMASTIISETQSVTIKNYEDSLRSNRHRKLFRKAQKEARRLYGDNKGNAEIISGIRKINDKDNYFAGLVRINKDLNKNGARFIINSEGKVEINSNYLIDPIEFSTLTSTERANILSSLPSPQQSISITVEKYEMNQAIVKDILKTVLNKVPICVSILKKISNGDLASEFAILLEGFAADVIKKLLTILFNLLPSIKVQIIEEFERIFPFVSLPIGLLQFIIYFMKKVCEELGLNLDVYLNTYFDKDGNILPEGIQLLTDEIIEWIRSKIVNLKAVTLTQITHDTNTSRIQMKCNNCSGFYFVTA